MPVLRTLSHPQRPLPGHKDTIEEKKVHTDGHKALDKTLTLDILLLLEDPAASFGIATKNNGRVGRKRSESKGMVSYDRVPKWGVRC